MKTWRPRYEARYFLSPYKPGAFDGKEPSHH